MKGKDVINFIKERGLEEFTCTFNFVDGYSLFPNHRNFEITGVADIGYSDKVIVFDGEEKF